SFALGIIVSNVGRGVNDSLGVCVTRTLPDGSIINYSTQRYKPVLNKDTVYFRIYYRGESSFGINNFTVTLNCGNKIQELDYSNNSGSIQYFMSKKSVICLMPQEFSIVSSQPVNFVAQTTNQLSSDSRQFYYEVDTSANFNSAFKKVGVINGNSLAEWKLNLLPDLPAYDSTVYYWRVRSSDPTPGQAIVWTTSSFLYIRNSPSGWSQSKFDQFYKLTNQGVVKDTINNKWAFQNSSFKLKITALGAPESIGSPLNTDNAKQVFVGMNGQNILTDPTNSCSDFGWNGVYSFAIDQYNFQLKQINPTDDRGQFCKQTTSGNAVNKFLINGNTSNYSPATLIQSFQNVTYGDFVVFFSVGNAAFGSSTIWTPALKQALTELGAKSFDKLKEGWPYILVARKGLPSQAIEILPDTNNLSVSARQQTITLDSLIKIRSLEGAVVSPEFGPASSWGNFYYKLDGNDAGEKDFFNL
ncbi:MAG: hypothetical protein K2Q22_10665, partial [Cytophagales bacterium]|nr:hypothetical protein [Cytophagales bacterium]